MSLPMQQRPKAVLQPGDLLVVIRGSNPRSQPFSIPTDIYILDDFDARSSDELTLRKTDQIELVELDEGFGDGWYLGRHLGHGTVGLFPGGM